MAGDSGVPAMVDIGVREPIWERFFWIAPLVIVGSREPDGSYDLAPKHMAFPMGWMNYFGFVCTPRHGTYSNVTREGAFTVTYPRPDQLVEASLAASPREEGGEKHILTALPQHRATIVDGHCIDGGYVELECRLERMVDGFGENSLIVGEVVAARIAEDALRVSDGDDANLLRSAPLLAYLHPGRFARIEDTLSFPFPAGMRK